MTYNQTEHIQNGVRRANVKKTKLNIFKTVRKTLTKLQILHNTFKTVRKALTYQTIKQNTHKTLHKAITSKRDDKTYIQNSARDTNVTNSQENSYQTLG